MSFIPILYLSSFLIFSPSLPSRRVNERMQSLKAAENDAVRRADVLSRLQGGEAVEEKKSPVDDAGEDESLPRVEADKDADGSDSCEEMDITVSSSVPASSSRSVNELSSQSSPTP